jgi:hypothetical protein
LVLLVSPTNTTSTSTWFEISLDTNTIWYQTRINFFASTRPDIEIGSLTIANPAFNNSFPATYVLVNRWVPGTFLKFSVFISCLNMTSQYNTLLLNLEKADISAAGVELLYSTRNSQADLNLLVVSLIIFDGYSPAYRFSEGIISQSNLVSSVRVQVPPPVGFFELRNNLIGFNSFEVNGSQPISFSALMNEQFAVQIGPLSTEC